MIVCTLDGEKAYPLTSEKIKVTYENPYVKDSGSYTYDITFPMAIAQNRKVFRNVQRMDVRKHIADFETCRLYVGNRLVISGKGTVTAVTNEKVKLQIVGGNSRIKYNSKFENHFIDEIDYPDVVLDTGLCTRAYMWQDSTGRAYDYTFPSTVTLDGKVDPVPVDLSSASFVGQAGVCVLSPVHDETNDRMVNRFFRPNGSPILANGGKYFTQIGWVTHIAPQPYVFYILRKVLEYEGYELVGNDFDKSPWNRLVIVSACTTQRIKDALPHWTVYKFLDEVRKFFNGALIFDEARRKVRFVAQNEMLGSEAVTVVPEDDFSVEYDEDGLDNIATSNIAYKFDSSANRDWRECITQAVLKQFDTKEYASVEALKAADLTDREKRTNIFRVGSDYYIWAELPPDDDPDSEKLSWQLTQCGYFNPVIRDIDSDNEQELAICPVAMFRRKNFDEDWSKGFDKMGNEYVILPSVTNEKEASYADMQEDDDGYYNTVQDAMESGTDSESTDSDESEDSSLRVAFQAQNAVNRESGEAVLPGVDIPGGDGDDVTKRAPVLYTDYRMFPSIVLGEMGTLSLETVTTSSFFGTLINSKTRFANGMADAHDQYAVKFITDTIPDPSRIYIIKNKRFVCEKVEVSVADDGIDKVKTGYFYEL